MPQCTSQVKEAAWTQRQNAYACEAAARAEAERIAHVAFHFHFSRNETKTHFTPSGFPVQLAMDLTCKTSGRTRTVIVANIAGTWVWSVERGACRDMSLESADAIACVQARIGARITAQLTGKVQVN